jgi:hypothetical protein
MLRHGSVFERAAAGFTRATLLDAPHPGPDSDPVSRVLAGEQWVTAG